MVQKAGTTRRGRPREYDPEVALRLATEAFWEGGFSGTSLDDLSSRTGMNRPSLYAAFGDKQALYLRTLERYRESRAALIRAALEVEGPLRVRLRGMYEGMIERYVAGGRGCYLMGTAVTEAVTNPAVREFLAGTMRELDRGFARQIAQAKERGELRPDADPDGLAVMAVAAMHTIALRARAGQPPSVLRKVADSAVKLICGEADGAPMAKRGKAR